MAESIVARTREDLAHVSLGARKLVENIKRVIYIDTRKLEYILAAKIAGGHVMLADSHGVGKTSLARALAQSIAWEGGPAENGEIAVEHFSRIQCTVDLLPQDILGYNRLDGLGRQMVFNKGPIFAHFVLCDEINLLTPKTQGSFFQAMEEQTVTIEGNTYILPDPFFIISTMNLKGAHLFPLPAPQLDRFMIQISLGFPGPEDEAAIVRQHGRDDGWAGFGPVVGSQELTSWQALVDEVEIHPEVIAYIVECVRQTRVHPDVQLGGSPRTGVKLSRMARALALIRGEDYVTVDLVKEILVPTVAHRLVMQDPSQSPVPVVEEVMAKVPVDRPVRAPEAR
jgi:MoxR-like ATPase